MPSPGDLEGDVRQNSPPRQWRSGLRTGDGRTVCPQAHPSRCPLRATSLPRAPNPSPFLYVSPRERCGRGVRGRVALHGASFHVARVPGASSPLLRESSGSFSVAEWRSAAWRRHALSQRHPPQDPGLLPAWAARSPRAGSRERLVPLGRVPGSAAPGPAFARLALRCRAVCRVAVRWFVSVHSLKGTLLQKRGHGAQGGPAVRGAPRPGLSSP